MFKEQIAHDLALTYAMVDLQDYGSSHQLYKADSNDIDHFINCYVTVRDKILMNQNLADF